MFLSDLSIARPVLALMLTAALCVFGLIAYKDLSIDLMPNVEFPVITITTVFRGADPETIETEVTDKIEEDLATLPGIKELISYSAENVSVIVIEFELEIDLDTATQDVRDRLSRLIRSLPEEIDAPIVEKLNFQSIPIVSVAVSGEGTPQDLARYVKDVIKHRVESVNGVGRVDIVGLRDREIRVWLNDDAMASYDVSAFEVIGALQRSNIQIPSGRVETGDHEYIVVTTGELKSVEEFRDVVVASRSGTLVRLRDVALVEDSLEDQRSISRLNGVPAVSLQVYKMSGANTIEVADLVKEEIQNLQSELPPGIRVTVPMDTSVYIRDSFEETKGHILGGGILAIIVVLFFLGNIRTTLIAAVTIPTSIITTFIFMRSLDFTLNSITMLAIALSVGMLVDDAIVVLENIYRHAEKGEDAMTASKRGSKEIAFAVLATTLSIVAVFIPVAFMRGIIGRFIYQYGITVTVAVSASYFVALSVAPMLASRFMSGEKTPFILFKWFDNGFAKLESGYKWLIGAALKHKGFTLLVAFITLILAFVAFGATPSEFETKSDDSQFQVNIELPIGSALPRTSEVAAQIEQILLTVPEVENTYTSLGGGTSEEQNKGSIYVDLQDKIDRERSKFEITDDLRGRFTNFPGAKIVIGEVTMVGGGFMDYDFSFELTGNDLAQLNEVANRFLDLIKTTPGFRDPGISFVAGKPEVRVAIDRDRAADLGIDAMSLGSTLNLLVSGEQAVTTYKEAGEQYDVRVRLAESYRDRPEDLLSLRVPNNKGEQYDLASFVSLTRGQGPTEIQHSFGQRRITVYSNLDIPLGEAISTIRPYFEQYVPPGVNVRITGMGDIMRESFESIGFSLILAIALIYMILAAQYNHFVHPLTIMISLPLSFVGAFGLLYISGMTTNIMSLIGVIMLMGLVTKNAILVVDFTNQLRDQGMERDEALKTAGPIRLRPVLMTTVSTIAGMLPVALMIGGGAGVEMRAPMAVAVIGGLITSTFLTLVVVPVVYSIFDQGTEWFLRVSGIKKLDEQAPQPIPPDQVDRD